MVFVLLQRTTSSLLEDSVDRTRLTGDSGTRRKDSFVSTWLGSSLAHLFLFVGTSWTWALVPWVPAYGAWSGAHRNASSHEAGWPGAVLEGVCQAHTTWHPVRAACRAVALELNLKRKIGSVEGEKHHVQQVCTTPERRPWGPW